MNKSKDSKLNDSKGSVNQKDLNNSKLNDSKGSVNQKDLNNSKLNESKVSVNQKEDNILNDINDQNRNDEKQEQDNNSQNDDDQNDQNEQQDSQEELNKSQNKEQLQKKKKEEKVLPFKLYDFIFPAGKSSKLCMVTNLKDENLSLSTILSRFQLYDMRPVLLLCGAAQSDKNKFYAGVARACYQTDAVIIDSGMKVGIETFVMRRNLNLLGIAPESLISYPKVNPTKIENNELANGHSHLFLIKKNEKESETQTWSDIVKFKFDVAYEISQGKREVFERRDGCKIVMLLVGDDDNIDYKQEISMAVEKKYPIIVVPGSELANEVIEYKKNKTPMANNSDLSSQIDQGFVYTLDDLNSEIAASYLHFFLTVNPNEPFVKKE